jgi:hypothetical protein
MEKTYDLCLEVLERLQKSGILGGMIIIGSWCQYFYKTYFSKVDYSSSIRTRDIDFLVPVPPKFRKKADVPEILKDLGFISEFRAEGHIRLIHPNLIIEFLVPERGGGCDKPYPLPQIGMNAQSLRFLDFLSQNSMKLKFKSLELNLPHPAAFALQKLIISYRRPREEKKQRDRQVAFHILDCLIEQGEEDEIRNLFNSFPKKWKASVLKALEASEEKNILALLAQ